MLKENDPDLLLLATDRGFLGLYRHDLPVDYAEKFMDEFTQKTGKPLVLIVNATLATAEKVHELVGALKEAVSGI